MSSERIQRLCMSAVRNILPYGDAFLFIDDAIVDLDLMEIETTKSYDITQPIIAAHFASGPHIVPGVLLVEQVCQSALLLGTLGRIFDRSDRGYLGRLRCSFPSPAVAPARVRAVIKIERTIKRLCAFSGVSFVKDREVVRVDAVSANLPK